MLEIKALHASINGTEILKGLNLTVKPGEVHAIMGPNGAGKSTLASVLAGKEDYEITSGEIVFDGKDLVGTFGGRTRSRRRVFGLSISRGNTRGFQREFLKNRNE